MKILLYKVNPVSGGEEAELYVELSSGENFERSKFTVSAEMFFELGFSVNFTGEQELSRERYEEITLFAERHSAVKRGLSILSFGDNTKKGLAGKLRTKGMALIPLELYFDEHNRVKLCIGLCRGKKLYDKRDDMARRDTDREIQRALKERSR